MVIDFTKEQRSAIEAKSGVLVSAAAGSGKTAVLVERVIRMLTDSESPVSADRLLIVTFTNAAAAEMRLRIEKRLDAECAANPNDTALMRQRFLLGSAKICTIDSFCIDLVRENFSLLGVQPDFRMDDGQAIEAFADEVLQELIQEQLAQNSSVFRDLLDITGSEFDERNLMSAIRSIFSYSCQLPFPNEFFHSLGENYEREFSANHPWFSYGMKRLEDWLFETEPMAKGALDLCRLEEKGASITAGLNLLLDEISQLRTAIFEKDWNAVYASLQEDYPKLGTITGLNDCPHLKTAKQLYLSLLEERAELRKLFCFSAEEVTAQINRLKEPIALLIELTRAFGERLFARQCEENTFTFYNTEQMAISMLCERTEEGIKLQPRAEELIARFDEVLVDEYQDVNDLQDLLFTVLSDRSKNLFVVGDVKQSIYGFRGANPKNFLKKRAGCKPLGQALSGELQEITLSKNFRSRQGVCDFVNFFFENVMSEASGGLVYDERERLEPAATFPETSEPTVQIQLVDLALCEEKEDKLLVEARGIAQTIKEILSSKTCVKKDNETLRPATYRDIAILMRSPGDKAGILAQELRRQGIPTALSNESFAETNEIETFSSLLKVLDNPKDDIALLTVLLSPIFSFTAEELASFRAAHKDGDLIAVITAAASNHPDAAEFLKTLSFLRNESVMLPLPKLISRLFALTDYPNCVAALEDGKRRYDNLMSLIPLAEKYTASGRGDLKGFIKFLSLHGKDLSSKTCNENENVVRIMSMHASKGLQFPICILANLGGKFNRQDSIGNVLFSVENGLGLRYFEEELHKNVTTLPHAILADVAKKVLFEEELRLLYVAMTRAEERLILVSTHSKLQNTLDKLAPLLADEDSKIGSLSFRAASSLSEWVIMAALLHPCGTALRQNAPSVLLAKDTPSSFELTIGYPEETSVEKIENFVAPIDTELKQQVLENVLYQYPFEELNRIEAKTTVSKLVHKAENSDFDFTKRPDFLEQQGLSAAAKGTAMHKVMQFVRFEEGIDLSSELDRLFDWRYISEEEYRSLNQAALQSFFDSQLYERILKAQWSRREMRFLTELPAKKIAPELSADLSEETVVVQGAVDLCFMEEDGLVVLDFKTDRVEEESQLVAAYGEQLSLYTTACEKIFGCRVKEKVIYSFHLKKFVKIL